MYTRLLLGTVLFLSLATQVWAKETKDWTIYIHMNADNSLCYFAPKDLAEIKSVDISANAYIIVSFDCSENGDSRIFEIQGNKEIDITKDILKTDGPYEFDMGDYKFFEKTAMLVFEKYPSEKRFIDIWNHGGGWRLLPLADIRDVSYDDESGTHITTPQLGVAMKNISEKYSIDILGFDACLMQMVEVSYEVADYTKYVLASEESEPGDGWDYKGLGVLSKSNVAPEEIGVSMVNSYMDFYKEGTKKQSVTMSFVSTLGIKELVLGLRNLVPELEKMTGLYNIIDAVPGYNGSFKDLGLFLCKLKSKLAESLKQLYKDAVYYNKSTEPGTGISIYLTTYPDEKYKTLKFDKDTGWFDMLQNIK